MAAPTTGWRILRSIGEARPVPWSNGAGTTRELVGFEECGTIGPAGIPRWRLSIALLERPGEFSPLPGIDRTLLFVGANATLSIDGTAQRLRHGDVVRFRGDQTVVLRSLSGPCSAVNLMVEHAGGASGPTGPSLRGGALDPAARLAVALRPGPSIVAFDLLERVTDVGVPSRLALPSEVASLTRL